MITSLQIERLEERLQRNRNAFQVDVKVSVGVDPIIPRSFTVRSSELPWIVLTRQIHGRGAVLEVVPRELTELSGRGAWARKFSVQLMREVCATQKWDILFGEPVRITNNGIYMEAPRGRGRYQAPQWQEFDPWLVPSGKPSDRKTLTVLGVRFI